MGDVRCTEMATGLPAEELVELGIVDLRARRETAASLLVSVGASRLSALGHAVGTPFGRPELRL